MTASFPALLIPLCLWGCGSAMPAPEDPSDQEPVLPPPWTAHQAPDVGEASARLSAAPVLIENGSIWIGDGSKIERGYVLLKNGKIASVGAGAYPGEREKNWQLLDATGQVVTPGLIDTHSHMGVYPMPRAQAHADGNEMTAPVTAEVRAADGFWAQDPAIQRAVAGGVTTVQILPGSANLIGGRGTTLKLRDATSAQAMHFDGAKDGLKMACGENPKRVYGQKGTAPGSRMGNLAGQRTAFFAAKDLQKQWETWQTDDAERRRKLAVLKADSESEKALAELQTPAPPPARNLQLETLIAAMEGHVLVHIHCYRADDMANMMALADEAGFRIRSFHHALEAYKIADELAKRNISVSTWADWWGFKMEAFDGIPESIALLEVANGRPIVHSDSRRDIRRLNQEASKALYAGRHAGMDVDPSVAIRWITINAAWALGIEDRVGTLEAGKDADVVVWSGDPLSIYTQTEAVFIDGAPRYERGKDAPPWSDFEVGR